MNKQPIIEFATPSPGAGHATLRGSLTKSRYKDLLLKPEFAARRYKFPVGTTWFRIVPALRGSDTWLREIDVLTDSMGRHAHPRTLTPTARSPYDLAYGWLTTNQPESLYGKSNMQGYRLLANPHNVCWILVIDGDKILARLVIASAYDSSRAGKPGLGSTVGTSGLGFALRTLIREHAEDGETPVDPLDPSAGLLVSVEKTQPAGVQYPSYRLRMGRQPAPIQDMLAKMEPEEIAAIRPLEEIIHIPSKEEEFELLESLIGAKTVAKIRAAQV